MWPWTKKPLKKDVASGNKAAAKKEAKDIKADKKDIKADKKDVKKDKKQIKHVVHHAHKATKPVK